MSDAGGHLDEVIFSVLKKISQYKYFLILIFVFYAKPEVFLNILDFLDFLKLEISVALKCL